MSDNVSMGRGRARFLGLPAAAVCLPALAASGCTCVGGGDGVDLESISIGGYYRAEIIGEGGDAVPFFIHLPEDESAGAHVRNGRDEIEADHTWDGADVRVEFPIYRTVIEATAREDDALVGSFRSESPAFDSGELEFRAEPAAAPKPAARFRAGDDPDTSAQMPEHWRLTFDDMGDGALSLTLEGDGGAEGTLHLENGNAIYLAGDAGDDRLRLSAFDGSSPYLLEAELSGDRLEGRWIAGPGLEWREPLTGAAKPDYEVAVNVNVAFAGSDYRPPVPELRQPPYRGSPTILALTGSWSPASMRIVPFLGELREEHAGDELQILALNYELTDDEDYNDEAVAAIVSRFDVDWEMIPIDGGPEDYATIMPAGFEQTDVQSFPVLAFIDRDGFVAAVRAGFPPEASGDPYAATVAEYRELAADLAAE